VNSLLPRISTGTGRPPNLGLSNWARLLTTITL
jgi:hypothetical protein